MLRTVSDRPQPLTYFSILFLPVISFPYKEAAMPTIILRASIGVCPLSSSSPVILSVTTIRYCIIHIISNTNLEQLNFSGHQAPCKEDDDKCILELAKTAYNKVIKGIPSIGVESSDPMWVNEIDGSLSILHYKLNNCSVTGFAECHINYFK